jgi:threonine aldolase
VSIDLRSDTVTRPSAGMRAAMMQAEVGDDVLGDDPTINALQARLARLLGKEAALFTPSGTMANQLGLRCQTEPGDEVLIHRYAHILHHEAGAGAALSGVLFTCFESPPGGCDASTLAPLRRPDAYSSPRTRLVALENTHNHRGGEVFEIERMRDVQRWARSEGLRVHLDGARLWNACVASGTPIADYAACADTVSVCFSKGLGAPVGSALAGDAGTIQRARRFRRMFGGAMRQAGILAAAALYGLDHNVERLAEDHRNARILAQAIDKTSSLRLRHPVQTNILMVEVVDERDSPAAVVADLKRHDVVASVWDQRTFRLVTHLDVSREDAERAAAALLAVRC